MCKENILPSMIYVIFSASISYSYKYKYKWYVLKLSELSKSEQYRFLG